MEKRTRLSNGSVLMVWPVSDHRITAGWTYSDGSAHGALDFGIAEGNPVIAAEDATVNWVQKWDGRTKTGNQSYGNVVKILHDTYNNKRLETLYAHLKTILVKSGERVKAGQIIGYSGNTGNSTGPHLHFEVRLNGAKCNPLNWLDNDFYKAYSTVKLGNYQSVQAPKELETESEAAVDEGAYFKKYTGDSVSISAALQAIGEDGSFDNRKKIAKVNGYPSDYTGTAAQNTNLLNLLKQGKLVKPAADDSAYFPQYHGTSPSIVAALNQIGADSTYAYRKQIAEKNGIENYTGTAQQNLSMIKLLQHGKLARP